ncbi:MAG TPA: SCP-2 sterol transfer family protein [Gammaproteobacteria bacterium]|nr:SCP-2 sterol transfer family protein [Gammaproteobacteria bacterium]
MPELFSTDWARKYKEVWNSSEGIADQLGQSNFNSIIAFGIDGENAPRIVFDIDNGQIVSLGDAVDGTPNWDIRAAKEDWAVMMKKPPGLMRLGLAYTSRKLKFKKGDYAVMIKDPSLSTAFVKCFALMSKALQ